MTRVNINENYVNNYNMLLRNKNKEFLTKWDFFKNNLALYEFH